MIKELNTNNAPFSILLGIQTNGPQQIQIAACDKMRNTWYENTRVDVNGYAEFYLPFPVTPQTLTFAVYNANGTNPNLNEGFKTVKANIGKVKTKGAALSAKDWEYINFLYNFAQNKAVWSADTILNGKLVPSIYGSKNNNFKFLYYNKLVDAKKTELNTPTMVGNDTGNVSWSKSKIMPLTVPMVVALGLHEYGHKYENPQNGLPIGNEFGADMAGLNIFRSGLGFSKQPWEYVFTQVLAGNQTPDNQKRLALMKKFNNDFDSGALDKYYTDTPKVKKFVA